MESFNIGLFNKNRESIEDKILFSLGNIQLISEKITENLKGVHPDGIDIIPLHSDIISELKFLQSRNVYIKIDKRTNTKPTLKLLIDECINRISNDIRSNFEMRHFRSVNNIWNNNMQTRSLSSDGSKSQYLDTNHTTPTLSFRMSM